MRNSLLHVAYPFALKGGATCVKEFPTSEPTDDNTWSYPCLWILLNNKSEDSKMCSIISSNYIAYAPIYIYIQFRGH